MPEFIPITGAVTGATVYINDKLVARDATITLPEIVPMTAEVKAMGPMTMPIWELVESLELAVTKVGIDLGFRQAITPGVSSIEVRFTQTQNDANGKAKTIMCKAFCKGQALSIPGVSVEVGSASENEIPYSLTRYQLFVNGGEAILVDRLAGKLRINGVDCTEGLSGL